jgi:hypothetical protein
MRARARTMDMCMHVFMCVCVCVCVRVHERVNGTCIDLCRAWVHTRTLVRHAWSSVSQGEHLH